MLRNTCWAAVISLAINAVSGSAHAQSALLATDTLAPGNAEFGLEMGLSSRRLTTEADDAASTIRTSSNDVGLSARVWLGSGVSLGVRQSAFFGRRATMDGSVFPIDSDRGFTDLQLDSRFVLTREKLRVGGQLELTVPTRNEFSLRRAEFGFGPIASYQVGRSSVVYSSVQYTARSGDSRFEAADTVEAMVGYQGRLGPIAVLPALEILRTGSHGGEQAFVTGRGQLRAAYGLSDGLSVVSRVEFAVARQHDIPGEMRGGGREVIGSFSLFYDVDIVPTQPPRTAEPAAIQLSDITNATARKELVKLIPGLRRATLDVERDVGRVSGTVRVSVAVNARGRISVVDLVDGIGSPRLARAIRNYYQGRPVAVAAGQLAFTVRFLQVPASLGQMRTRAKI